MLAPVPAAAAASAVKCATSPSANRCGLVVASSAPDRSRQARVRTGTPPNVVGRPATPTQRSRWTGWSMMPSTGQPSSSSAISVPKMARPATKERVPSIGSRTHCRPDTPAFTPYSSPWMPSPERSASISRRIAASASRSARVTGEASSLSSSPAGARK